MRATPNVPNFELIRCLGRGGFGEVWMARSLTGVHRAIKIISKANLRRIEVDGIRSYQTYAHQHPHLVEVLHVGESEEFFYYVMELADNGTPAQTFDPQTYEPCTLATHVSRHRVTPVDEAIDLALQVLSGLSHLHQCGLIHRDVKPANILFVRGAVKLADIGLVVRPGQGGDKAYTPLYSPPEGVVDASGDLYCLGKVLFQLVTGTSPERFPSLPSELDRANEKALQEINFIVDRACDPNPKQRFQFATEFTDALEACRQQRHRGWSNFRGRRKTWAVAALITLAVGVGWLLRSSVFVPAQTQERLQVLFRIPGIGAGGILSPAEHPPLPLRTGNQIRVRGRLPQSAYAYVLLVNSAGDVSLVYPQPERVAQEPVRGFDLPKKERDWWTLEQPAGTETIILLTKNKPLENPQDLATRIQELGRPPRLDEDMLVVLRDGRVAAWRRNLRSIVTDQPATAQDGYFERLASQFDGEFDHVEAIAFPHTD